MISIETQNGYFVFYDRNGNEISEQMSAEEAIENIRSIQVGMNNVEKEKKE